MRYFSRRILTGVLLLAYVAGGLIVPVAHTHSSGDCCSDGSCSLVTQTPSAKKEPSASSCTDPDCPFGHASCQKTGDDRPTCPSKPHSDCAACRLLYMASTTVQFVFLPTCEDRVEVAFPASRTFATLADVDLPQRRGPPAC